jgi:hypothetical protein
MLEFEMVELKGTVQRDLRGVKSGINRQVSLQATNASLWILVLYGRRFEICVKPFSVS